MAVLSRPSWDEYFLQIAGVAATRSTCLRRQVGCVLVKDSRVLATGYNGSPPGLAHCTQIGCKTVGDAPNCVRTIHAEANAFMQAARHGVSVEGATLYTTCSLCLNCAKLALAGGVKEAFYQEPYEDSSPLLVLSEAGVSTTLLNPRRKEATDFFPKFTAPRGGIKFDVTSPKPPNTVER